jgi:CheY-like chemotaxis protein
VQYSARSLLSIINDILDLSKIEAGKLELRPVVFDLNELLANTRALMGARAEEKGLTLEYQMCGEPIDWVIGDDVRLRQILVNLLGNAVKFTPDNGLILTIVEATSLENNLIGIHISVSDTAGGIPPDRLEAIFAPFVQADGSTTRKFGGTGLGLAICRQLVEMMDGQIWVENKVGFGATFHVKVPLRRATRSEIKEHLDSVKAALPDTNVCLNARVLLVEDNLVNQKLAIKLLEKLGCEVSVAGDGQEAVVQLTNPQHPFDLVLMDCQMPRLDGYDATRTIRRSEQATGRHVPIIAMTANAMTGDREKCLEAGMDDYLSKPIDRAKLRDLVTRLTNKQLSCN